MKLSIIIPVFNVERYIIKCLDSLYNQEVNENDYEIIIINDGSNDNSLLLAEKFKVNHKNLHIYTQENQGIGAARNKGISLAKGDYIYFIDPDDYLLPGVLNTLIDYSNAQSPDVLTFISISTTVSSISEERSNIAKPMNISTDTGINYIANNNYKNEVWWYFIKKSFLDTINLKFIEGKWMEDAIFTASLLIQAKRVIAVPIDAHRHVKVEGSAMTKNEPNHYLKIINDKANIAIVFNSIINELKANPDANERCIKRLRSRQQSFVFFMLLRIMKSTIDKVEILPLLNKMKQEKAYPLNYFLGEDYNGWIYTLLSKCFSNKYFFYFIFLVTNPILKKRT